MSLDSPITSAFQRPAAPADAALQRGLAIVGLLGIALIHIIDLPGKLEETPYLGGAFIALIVASLLLAIVLSQRDLRIAWLLAGALAAATVVGYVLSRTTGLPASDEDIGNWLEPLGLASLFVEGTVVVVTATALWRSSARALVPATPN